MKHRSLAVAAVAALAIFGGAASTAAAPSAALPSASSAVTGTLDLTGGGCSHGSVSGSYIQMVLPSGSVSGPYMSNSDSSCSNQAYTLLTAGTEGGLRFGSYQPLPSPAFDSAGNARADELTEPAQYEGTGFATSTNPVDPQTHTKAPAPSLTIHGDKVTADLSSFSVSWNNQYFNQGAPKPDGSDPGITHTATGSYDASTGAMTLSWASQVVGGPFDKFTGSWHLAGRFVPASASSSASSFGHSRGGASSHSGAAVVPSASASAVATATAMSGAKSGQAVPTASAQASSEPAAVAAPRLAVTSVVSKHTWHVSWWLIVLAVVIALAGFGGLGALRRGGPTGSTPTS
jgi:hypothetical protein